MTHNIVNQTSFHITYLYFTLAPFTDATEPLLESGGFESVEKLEEELFKYMIYYNEIRPHQSLNGKTPLSTIQNLSSN